MNIPAWLKTRHRLIREFNVKQEIANELSRHNFELRAACRELLIYAKACKVVATPGGAYDQELDERIAMGEAALKL